MPQPPLPSYKKWKNLPFVETNPKPFFTKKEKSRGYIIFQRPVTNTIYPNSRPLDYEKISRLEGFAAKGEFEPLTFSIYPNRKLENLRVSVSELKSSNSVISSSSIDVRLTTYWKMRYPLYISANTYRRIPELLEKVNVHSSPAFESQRYWITIETSKNTKPGLYHGSVSISDDSCPEKVTIPISFRVLDFSLIKDPQKHYTAYHYDLHKYYKLFPDKQQKEWLDKAIKNEYKAMKDFGFDIPPVLRLKVDLDADEVVLPENGRAIARLKEAGITGTVPVCINLFPLYGKHIKRKTKHYPHWANMPKMPPKEFYSHITRLFREFEKKRKKRNWPEFIYFPLDEVAVSASKFGSKVYKAFKDAGCKTGITKDPIMQDAKIYAPYVDIFCSESFAVDYETIQKSKHEYWSYPNHNAGQTKIPAIRSKGGRMTYGYGFWRSGYSTLVPWIWRWGKPMKKIDYLKHRRRSETGMQLNGNGEVVPTPYWMCFREGYDDVRYLYTLQTAIVRREGTKNKECLKLLNEGKLLIQDIWDRIDVQKQYIRNGIFNSREFNTLRWKMAVLIQKILKYKAVNNKISPSVITDTSSRKKHSGLLNKKNNIEILDLGGNSFSKWKSVTKEGVITVKDGVMRYEVNIDHKTDGGGEVGKYPVGWPRIKINFKKNELNLNKYDYISMWISVDSNRDEVADDYTFLAFNISSYYPNAPKNIFEQELLGAVTQRNWMHILIPIKQITKGENHRFFDNIRYMQIHMAERHYSHGDKLIFLLKKIHLIRMKEPVIKSADYPRFIILPEKQLIVRPEILGLKPDIKVGVKISNASGEVLLKKSLKLNKKNEMIIDIESLKKGKYKLTLSVEGSNSVYTGDLELLNSISSVLQ